VSDVHGAVGSYAVDALTPVERAEFEAHLTGCASCRSELTEYADALGELNLLVSARPPAALRTSVLAAVGGLAQVRPPRTRWSANGVGQDDHGGADAAPRRALRAPVTELRPPEPHEVAPLEEHPSVVPDTPWLGVAAALSDDVGRRSRRREGVLGTLLAVALTLALVLGGWLYVSQRQLESETAEERQGVEVLTASDVKIHTSRADMAAVSYVVSRQRNQVLFLGNNLPVPTDGSTYQLWIFKGDKATSAGLVPEGGDVRQVFSGPVRDADKLALTLEPAPHGSATPSDQHLFTVSLSSS
jgi:Anti-sigma-K factor rskA/Putative zinc-finger